MIDSEQKVEHIGGTSWGMFLDGEIGSIPDNAYPYGLDVEQDPVTGELVSERGHKLCGSLPEGAILKGFAYIRDVDDLYVFLVLSDGSSEIGKISFSDCKYCKVLNDEDVPCSLNFKCEKDIRVEWKRHGACQDIKLYWSVDDEYYTYNAGAGLPVETCEELKMMRCPFFTAPVISKIENSGADILAGNYTVYIRAGDSDGNYTNWKGGHSPVALASKTGRAGDRSKDALRVRVSVNAPNYEVIEIAVFDMTNEPSLGRVVAIVNAGESEIDFTYNSRSQYVRDVSLQDCELLRPGYAKGKGLVQRGRSLILYDLATEVNVDWALQAMATEPVIEVLRVPLKYAHNFPGLRPGEVYSTYLHWNYCDSTSTKRFHLPGNKVKPSGEVDLCGCTIPSWRFSGGEVTSANGGDPYEISESADSDVTRSPDRYEEFTPSQTDVMSPDDASIPDVTEMLDAAPQGDDCECQAHQRAIARASGGIRTVNTRFQIYVNAYEYELRQCRCSDGGTPPGLSGQPDGFSNIQQGELSGLGVNQQVYNAILNSLTYENAVSYHASVGQTEGFAFNRTSTPEPLITQEQLEMAFDSVATPSPPEGGAEEQGLIQTTTSNTETSPTSSGAGCGNSGGETPPNSPQGNDPTQSLSGRTAKEPLKRGVTGDPNWEVTTSEDCDGLPENGSVPNSSGTDPNSSQDDGGFSETSDNSYGGSVSGSTGYSGEVPDVDCEPELIYAEDGCTVIEVRPCLAAEMKPAYFESADHVYPETTKCCEEGLMYGEYSGRPVMYLKIPDRTQMPHVLSLSDGVPTADNGGEDEGQDTFVHVLRVRYENITPPDPDRLSKPLDEANPFTISVVPRNGANKSVVASGVSVNTFIGDVQRRPFAFTRLGVNSPEIVDRYIDDGTGLRVGSQDATADTVTTPSYGFYSPDTLMNRPTLDARWFLPRLNLYGKGHRHGLYAEGIEPGSKHATKENSKGARAAVHLNHVSRLDDTSPRCVSGQSYVEADESVSRGDQFTFPLMNRGREATTYIETSGTRVPLSVFNGGADRFSDRSFAGDCQTHSCPITIASAVYADIVRDLPNQYGGINTQLTKDIHHGTQKDLTNGTVRVDWGDSFVQRVSVKRFSYVSDSVGEDIRPPYEYRGGVRGLRFIGNLLKAIFTDIGAGECGTVPQSGNAADPRNMQVSGSIRSDAGCTTVADYGYTPPGQDKYFPATQKTLMTFYADSDVVTAYRIGADGDKTNAHYRDLAGMSLDSSFPGVGEGYQNSYLDIYDARLTENPKWKMLVRMLFNLIWTYVVGCVSIVYGMSLLAEAASRFIAGLSFSILVVVATLLGLGFVILGVFWIITWVNTNHDNRFIDNLLKVSDCFPDRLSSSGRYKMKDDRVRGFTPNFYSVDPGLLPRAGVRAGVSIGYLYNVCDCSCERSMDIIESEVQDPSSEIDAYRNFRGYRFALLPMGSGPMVKAFTFRGRFYVHTTDNLYPINFEEARASSTRGGIPSATAVPYTQGVPQGYGGLQDFYSSQVTTEGYVFVDREAGKLFIFNGQSMSVMVPEGANAFADTEIAYGQQGARGSFDCDGPMSNLTPCGFVVGFDPVGDRMIVSKIGIGESDSEKGWTLSMRPASENVWRPSSWHRWKPTAFIPTRSRLVAYASGKFYVIGDNESRSMLGQPEQKPYVTMVVTPPEGVNARYSVDTVSVKAMSYGSISPLYALRHRWARSREEDATTPIKEFMCFGDVQATGWLDIQFLNEEESLIRRDGVVDFYIQRPWYRTNYINNRLQDGGDGGSAGHPGYAEILPSLYQPVEADLTDGKRNLEVDWLAFSIALPETTFARLSKVAMKGSIIVR